jgi:hypothetical protein
MKCKVFDIHIKFQRNLLKGVGDIWERPLIIAFESGFIVDQYT